MAKTSLFGNVVPIFEPSRNVPPSPNDDDGVLSSAHNPVTRANNRPSAEVRSAPASPPASASGPSAGFDRVGVFPAQKFL